MRTAIERHAAVEAAGRAVVRAQPWIEVGIEEVIHIQLHEKVSRNVDGK
jgi:hypothetical protein